MVGRNGAGNSVDHAEFAADSDKGIDRLVELRAFVPGAHLGPDACLAHRHDGVREADHVNAPLEESFREARCQGRVDILTGTLGKALGGAAGGYTSARKEIVAWLRQRSRPYLFSNSVPPVIAATTLRVLDLVESSDDLRARLRDNTAWFRQRMTAAGFTIVPGEHPIAPVMLGDAALAARFAERLLDRGVYVIGFSYPVVPMGKARIRTQMSAGHDRNQLDRAIEAFIAVGRELGVIS